MNSNPVKKVLFADSDSDEAAQLISFFEKERFVTTWVTDGGEVLSKALEIAPDIIILEVLLPSVDGIELCYELRKLPQFRDTVIVFISNRSEDFTQIAALEAGADDYLLKPIRARLLLSHIRAIERRLPQIENPLIIFDKQPINEILDVDTEKCCAVVEGKEIALPRKEFEILSLLLSKRGRVYSRSEIFSKIWAADTITNERAIDVHIRKLRKKIGEKYIITHKGLGYKVKV